MIVEIGDYKMIRKGDIVRIKKEWQDAGDENLTWVARSDEIDGRFDMSALETAGMVFWPMSTTKTFMVEETGRHLNEDGSITPKG